MKKIINNEFNINDIVSFSKRSKPNLESIWKNDNNTLSNKTLLAKALKPLN